MHQLYKHTYTISTQFSTRPALRFSHISAPMQPTQTNPPTTTDTHAALVPTNAYRASIHKHTRPYSPTDTHDAASAPDDVDVDVDADALDAVTASARFVPP